MVIEALVALSSDQSDDPPLGLYGQEDDDIAMTTHPAAYTAQQQPDCVTSMTFLNRVEHSAKEVVDPAAYPGVAMATARRCHSESQLLSTELRELVRARPGSSDAFVTEQVHLAPYYYYQGRDAEWRGSVYASDYFPPTAETSIHDQYSTFAA